MEASYLNNFLIKNKHDNYASVKKSNLKLCKNKVEMPFKDLLASVSKKLMIYAMVLTKNNEADSWDLLQSTLEKLIKNKEKFRKSNQPVGYAKTVLKNTFIDTYRKNKRLISIEANYIEISNDGVQEVSVEYQEMLKCLNMLDEADQTILQMLARGYSYEEIQEFIGNISLGNLRVKAKRARIKLAKCIGKTL